MSCDPAERRLDDMNWHSGRLLLLVVAKEIAFFVSDWETRKHTVIFLSGFVAHQLHSIDRPKKVYGYQDLSMVNVKAVLGIFL